MKRIMQFDLPKDGPSIIKVIGVGGGGSNAVNHMFRQGIKGVEFIVSNTDQQALEISPVPTKIQLGAGLTEGMGAGSIPEVGRNAALENIEQIKDVLDSSTKMVFITAGMGGGTGTGAAPVIASVSKELGILTVGIVTIPFVFEGRKRRAQAEEGIREMRKYVDTLIVISNDKLRDMYGNLSLANAFGKADDILTTAARGIAEIITVTGYVNVDFKDVKTVMTNGGTAIMGSAVAEGQNRARVAVENALSSPLLNDNNIKGAKYILLNITSGMEEVLMDEITEITDFIQNEAGDNAEIIWGTGTDETLGNQVSITLIATGFNTNPDLGLTEPAKPKIILNLVDDVNKPIVKEEKTITHTLPKKEFKPVTYNLFTDTAKDRKLEDVIQKEELLTPQDTFIQNSEPLENKTELIVETKMEETFTDEITIVDEPSLKIVDPKEVTFEFEMEQPIQDEPLFVVDEENTTEPIMEQQELVTETTNEIEKETETYFSSSEITPDLQLQKSKERILKLKELSFKLKTSPSAIVDLENEPAYKRRNVELSNVAHSSESQVSRFTVSEGEDNKTELKQNNSFLHDNVD